MNKKSITTFATSLLVFAALVLSLTYLYTYVALSRPDVEPLEIPIDSIGILLEEVEIPTDSVEVTLEEIDTSVRETILPAHVTVKATVYQGVEEQTDSTFNITAVNAVFSPEDPPRWIAVSRDLLEIFPYGTGVLVTNTGIHDGVFIVMDTMHKRKKNQIDILISTLFKPGDSEYGKWDNVVITKLYPNVS